MSPLTYRGELIDGDSIFNIQRRRGPKVNKGTSTSLGVNPITPPQLPEIIFRLRSTIVVGKEVRVRPYVRSGKMRSKLQMGDSRYSCALMVTTLH